MRFFMDNNNSDKQNKDVNSLDDTRILRKEDLDITQVINRADIEKTKVNICNNYNAQSPIDDEMEQSIKRLIEEETDVARAAYAQDGIADMGTGNENAVTNDNASVTGSQSSPNIQNKTYNSAGNNNMTVNQAMTSDGSDTNDKTMQKTPVPDNENSDKNNTNKHNAAKNKKKKIIIISVVAAVIIIAAVVAVLVVNNNKKASFGYNYDKAMEYYNQGNYADAETYFEKAYEMADGRNNVDLMEKMYTCCFKTGNDDKAVDYVKKVLEKDKNNQKALETLGKYYYDNSKADELNEILEQYKNEEGFKYLKGYMPDAPKPSEDAGTYSKALKLTFEQPGDGILLYTTDGTDPKTDGSKYSKAILLDEGTTRVRAVVKNEKGIYSEESDLTYNVVFKVPDAPVINPESGKYNQGTVFTIENISEGDTAYYTFDGSSPDENSDRYAGLVEIPVGNTVLSVVIISENGEKSSVIKKNYDIVADLSYDEALCVLKNRMAQLNAIDSSGTQDNNGNAVSFVYQSKITVSDIEMYYIRYDVKEGQDVKTQGYFGVGLKDKKCYKVVENAGSFTCSEY